MMAGKTSADETVASLLARNPRAARVLMDHGMQCVGCAIAPFESLADVCLVYGVPLEQLLEALDVDQERLGRDEE
jgi:hybrid cluster-associated redox disulfide protein